MDNVGAHHRMIIHQMIPNAGHRVAFHALYHPVDGPVEYFFNTLANEFDASNVSSQGFNGCSSRSESNTEKHTFVLAILYPLWFC
jgi:transposase